MEFIRRRGDFRSSTSTTRTIEPPPEKPIGKEEYLSQRRERDIPKYNKYNQRSANPLRPLMGEEFNQPKVRDLLNRLLEEKQFGEERKDTQQKKKFFKFPRGWKSKANKSSKKPDTVLVFYLNIKGEIQQPLVVPIYSGNMIIIKNKIHEVDPRAMWNLKIGMKNHKVLIIKEIDRRPVSNLDLDEIRARGDATDSDEFLIKAALRAQTASIGKPIPVWVWVILAIVIGGALIFFFTQK